LHNEVWSTYSTEQSCCIFCWDWSMDRSKCTNCGQWSASGNGGCYTVTGPQSRWSTCFRHI